VDAVSVSYDAISMDSEDFQEYSDEEESLDGGSLRNHERDELQSLVSLQRDFQMIAQECFDPIVAEYLVKAQEWQVLRSHWSLLQLAETSSLAGELSFHLKWLDTASQCTRNLLVLRRRALAKGLQESLS
jgi:hypothetical protein